MQNMCASNNNTEIDYNRQVDDDKSLTVPSITALISKYIPIKSLSDTRIAYTRRQKHTSNSFPISFTASEPPRISTLGLSVSSPNLRTANHLNSSSDSVRSSLFAFDLVSVYLNGKQKINKQCD